MGTSFNSLIFDIRLNCKKNYGIIFAAICACLCGIISAYTPYHIDDIGYLSPFYDYKEGITDSIDWNLVWEQICWQYEYINGRLGDKVLYIFLLMPKCIFAVICSIAIFTMLYYASKIAFDTDQFNYKSIILSSAIIIFFPWNDHMFLVAFSNNYVISSALSLTCVYYFFNPQRINTNIKLISICLLSIIAAPWHEFYGFVIAIAITIYFIFEHKNRNKTQYTIYLFWLSGCLFFIISPGMWHRYEHIGEFNLINFLNIARLIMTNGYLIIFFLATSIIYFCFKKKLYKPNTINRNLIYFAVTICIINLLFCIKTSFVDARVLTFGILYAIIALNHLLTEKIFKRNIIKTVGTITISLFTISHLFVAITWQTRLYNQYYSVINLYKKSTDGVVFYNIIDFNEPPFICLRKTFSRQFHGNCDILRYYNPTQNLSIVPRPLFNIRFNQFSKTSTTEIYKYNDYFISTIDSGGSIRTLTFSDNSESAAEVHYNKYNNKYGETLYYLDIQLRFFDYNKKIIDIK